MNTTKKISYNDTRDCAIRIIDKLINLGLLDDNDDHYFDIQDTIQDEYNNLLGLDIDDNFEGVFTMEKFAREKFARKCTITGEGMNEGWVIEDGWAYAKSEKDALKLLIDKGYKSIEDAYESNNCYWTDWQDDESDWQYQLIDGKLEEIQ